MCALCCQRVGDFRHSHPIPAALGDATSFLQQVVLIKLKPKQPYLIDK